MTFDTTKSVIKRGKRKTVLVASLVAEINRLMTLETLTRAERRILASLLESILHNTGNYRGFRYLYSRDLPEGVAPGIVFDETEARNHIYPDDSRVAFY